MEDINILGEYENIELTTLLRTFKREGIENFVVVRKNNLENLIKAYKELEEFKKQVTEIENTNFIKYKNYIPVSLVEETIKKLKENGYWNYLEERDLETTIEILQELLGGNRNVSIL